MPETCVFWQWEAHDVDRRGNNNENTIKSRLHTFSSARENVENLKGVASENKKIYGLKSI